MMTAADYINNNLANLTPGKRLWIPYLLLSAPRQLPRKTLRQYLIDHFEQLIAQGYTFSGATPGVILRNRRIKLNVHYVKIGGIWRTNIYRISRKGGGN